MIAFIKNSKICRSLLIAAFWLAVWWVSSLIYGLPIIFPSPLDVFKELILMMGTGAFYLATLKSLLNVLIGIVIAIVSGILLALLTAHSKLARELLHPIMTVIKTTPVASFIILAYVLIGAQKIPSFITFLIVLPVVWTNLDVGFQSVDKQLLEMTKVYRFSAWKRMKTLIFPTVMPYLLSACRTSLGLAWKAGIAAEIIAMPLGTIGIQIGVAKQYLESTEVFAWTLTVILLSLMIEYVFSALFRRLTKKYEKGGVDYAEI